MAVEVLAALNSEHRPVVAHLEIPPAARKLAAWDTGDPLTILAPWSEAGMFVTCGSR